MRGFLGDGARGSPALTLRSFLPCSLPATLEPSSITIESGDDARLAEQWALPAAPFRPVGPTLANSRYDSQTPSSAKARANGA